MNSENTFDKRIDKVISTVKNTEAELKDPASLTNNIMSGLPDRAKKSESKRISMIQHVIFRRMISAAAIILFSVFAFEQYVILDKLNRLEESQHDSRKKTTWELRTVMKYKSVKENHKTLFDIAKSLGKDKGTKPGILKQYFQHKTRVKINKQNKVGIH